MALDDLLQVENPPEPPKPEKDRLAAFQLLATMYIKYIQIFRKLESCYDQIVHPQKRRVLRHVLDGMKSEIILCAIYMSCLIKTNCTKFI